MASPLDEILINKQKEVDLLIEEEQKDPRKPLEFILNKHKKNNHIFRDALKVAGLSVIGEIKRRAPSSGELAIIEDPVKLAHAYSKAGAAAVAVLTDSHYFGGSLEDLKSVAKGLEALHPCPVLSEDFIIHPYQIAQAKKAGASAVLLIVQVLKDRLREFLDIVDHIGLDALVEVHNEEELKIALSEKAQIIGVNNRNLKTYEVNLGIAKTLASKIPKGVVKIAESGILSVEDAHAMHEAGYDGVLVGELLIKSHNFREIISEIGNV